VGVDFQDDTAAPTCSDGILNSTETDVDCGGANMFHMCSPCADGKRCLVGSDCVSAVCTGGVCGAPTCSDGVTNGGESGVDCGGMSACPRCADGQTCRAASDCVNGICGTDMRCATPAPTCSDGILNSTETDVDCGGANMLHMCPACADGKRCLVGGDCVSGVCTGGVCSSPTCADGVTNGGESGVDCGGMSGCPRCADGQTCRTGADCVNGTCGTDMRCASATTTACTDGVKDGNETDVDCGGSCAPCAFGGVCLIATDCVSGVCGPMRRCLGSCTDGVKDGHETDVDCGFTCNVGCGTGQGCVTNNDCAGNLCVGAICQATTCTDGLRSMGETDVDCGGAVCRACAAGQRCRTGSDCFNGQCGSQMTCTNTVTGCSIDGILDNDETDLDCGGSCPACAIGLRCLVNTDCQKPHICLGGVCVASACNDGVQDGTETDVDCGGTCPACASGAGCQTDLDCTSGSCVSSICL
jgi:hypothetical protein